MMLIYKPFGIVLGVVAGLLSKRVFNAIWAAFDDEQAPKPTDQEVPMAKVVAAAALQGVVFKATRAAVSRQGAQGFYHLTGAWPGQRQPDRKD